MVGYDINDKNTQYQVEEKWFELARHCREVQQNQIYQALLKHWQSGMPIIGVTVMIPSTTVGTTTGLDGNYSLTVPLDTEVLSFTFIGMVTQEVVIGGRSVINIVMEQSKTALDEVIVTGVPSRTGRPSRSLT